MFANLAGGDLIDQLKFAADEGFTAFEDNGMMGQSADMQEKIAKEMTRLGLTMGVFVAYSGFAAEMVTDTSKNFQDSLRGQMKMLSKLPRGKRKMVHGCSGKCHSKSRDGLPDSKSYRKSEGDG